MAASTSMTCGSTAYSTVMSASAARAIDAVVAATAATACPT
jgi:hypothetical protein